MPPVPAPSDRRLHGNSLRTSLLHAERELEDARARHGIAVQGARPGLYIQFESPPAITLKLESLENRGKGIELVAVQRIEADAQRPIQLATVLVPPGAVGHFLRRFEQYATETTKKGEPKHKALVDRIAAIRRATLRALWTDDPDGYPLPEEAIWWEVWLRRHDGAELARLLDFSGQVGLAVGERRLVFHDRIVVLVKGSEVQFSASIDVLSDVAEVRRAKECAGFFVDLPAAEQAGWIEDLLQRALPPPEDAPAVCILDTGVTRGHPLLIDLIAPEDATAVDPTWGAHDDGGGPQNMGHGTEMAGLAAYGDLTEILATSGPVTLRHRIESVKILPPRGANPPELYGAITAQAVARPEVTAPMRLRAFSMAVTAKDERDRGQPTSWSSAIDAMSAGRTFDTANQGLVYLDRADAEASRLFLLSAGNVEPARLSREHLDRSDLEGVHDPAQAWNALTVGAFTEKAVLRGSQWEGWSPLALPGELSPWSTTSVTFQDAWPVKPDLVFEGGNVACDGTNFEFAPDLCLLSTHFKPAEKPLVSTWATSAATAVVARMAAILRAEYPEFWPQTIRALLVHSAKWTRAMDGQLLSAKGKPAQAKLFRRYGFGVPNLEAALRSANDAVTLVAQGTIHPFSLGKMREMHLHDLPWPATTLAELGEQSVRLRITLSYFIEPNPGRRGWAKRHRYASHGLRFDVKRAEESGDEFRKRLNRKALDEGEQRPRVAGDSKNWALGEALRSKGSIHSDTWMGTAAELASRSVVGIYPVSGWWKDQPKRDRSENGARYALVVSIETEAQDVDIWTPVAQQIGVPVEVVVET